VGSLHAFFFTFAFCGLNADLFVVLLEGSEILTGLREFSLFHALSDVPMYESSLGVHKIEFVINAGEDLGDSGRVGDHAHGAHNLGKITTGDDGRGLVVDSTLETGGAPVNELDGPLGLDGGDSGVDILGDDITSVHKAAGHVFTVAGIALSHHACGLEGGVGETYDWVVNDMAVINLGAAFVASPINEQITVTIACDANGYNYNSYSSGSALDAEFPVISLPGFG
jgi:hypothetical protein